MTRRLAVVPARGGSKRIPRKNIRAFHGAPMLSHALRAAGDSGLFDVVHVSTEDAEIAEVAGAYGHAPEFLRAPALAGDLTPIMPVLKFVLQTYAARDRAFDIVALLTATAPLVDADDLRAACRAFEDGDRSAPVMSVAKYPAPVEWAYRLRPEQRLEPIQAGAFAIRSQDLEDAYYDTGSFAFFDPATILHSEGAGSDADYRGYVLPAWKAVDIDAEADWQTAERLFAAMRQA